jgi:hypothetical protein
VGIDHHDEDRAAAGGGLHSQHPSWDTGQPESGLPTAVSLPVAAGVRERVAQCIGHKGRESVRVEAMEGRSRPGRRFPPVRAPSRMGRGRVGCNSSRIDAPRLSPSPLALQHSSKVPPDRDPHRERRPGLSRRHGAAHGPAWWVDRSPTQGEPDNAARVTYRCVVPGGAEGFEPLTPCMPLRASISHINTHPRVSSYQCCSAPRLP